MSDRQFVVTHEEDNFLLGHFQGESTSGAFLTPEYLGRLRQVRLAVGIRLEVLGIADPPDALKNLLGIIDRLTAVHARQAKAEHAPGTDGDIEAFEIAQRELAKAVKDLQDLQDPPTPPDSA